MIKHHAPALLIYSFLALLVALPTLIHPGQIFLLDLALPPSLDLSALTLTKFGASMPVTALFALLGTVLSVGVVMKMLMLVVLLLPMLAMYFLLVPRVSRPYAILGGMLLLYNPFMYERFVAGHWFVMLGVGYLPILFLVLRRSLAAPSYPKTALLALTIALYPIVSLHLAYVGILLALCYFVVHIVATGIPAMRPTVVLRHLALIAAILISVDSYLLMSVFATGSALLSIDARDFSVFVTTGDPHVGVYANVLALYGFWRESAVLPKDVLPLWWIPSLIIFIVSAFGLFVRIKKRDTLAWVALITIVPLVVVAVGFASAFAELVTRALIRILPGFTGLRETAKLVGVIAFFYAYFVPFGLEQFINRLYGERRVSRVVAASLMGVAVLATSFTFIWGALGQVNMGAYPPSWSTVDQMLQNDPSRGKVLVFPWRGYMELSFAGDAFVANPGEGYFTFPVEVAKSINNVAYDRKYATLFDALIPIDKDTERTREDIAALKARGVTHVILLKTSDWERYTPILGDGEYFTEEFTDDAIALYKLN